MVVAVGTQSAGHGADQPPTATGPGWAVVMGLVGGGGGGGGGRPTRLLSTAARSGLFASLVAAAVIPHGVA